MPIYQYRCAHCGREKEEFQHIREEPLARCPGCGWGSYHRVPTVPHTDMQEFRKPIEMHSLGLCHEDEIREFRRRNPDIQISGDPNDELYGVPVVHNRKQKLDVLKSEGFEERN